MFNFPVQSFSKVDPKVDGYNVSQVEYFLNGVKALWGNPTTPITERFIRFQIFPAEKGGYSPVQIDQYLIKLERILAMQKKAEIVNKVQIEGWMQAQNNRITELWGTLSSKDGQKFNFGKKNEKSYSTKEVDKLINQIKAQFFEGKQSLTSQDLRLVKFEMTKGTAGYSTFEVDSFLDEVISIFNQLEID